MFTLDSGRCIVKDGTPLATIHGVGNYVPAELDELARRIVELLQYDEELLGSFPKRHKNLI